MVNKSSVCLHRVSPRPVRLARSSAGGHAMCCRRAGPIHAPPGRAVQPPVHAPSVDRVLAASARGPQCESLRSTDPNFRPERRAALRSEAKSATRQRYTRPCSVPPGAADVSPAPGPAPALSNSLRLFLRVRHHYEALRSRPIVPLVAHRLSQYPRGSQAVSSPARHVSRTPSESVPILAHGPSVPLAPIVSAPASVPLGARAVSSPARWAGGVPGCDSANPRPVRAVQAVAQGLANSESVLTAPARCRYAAPAKHCGAVRCVCACVIRVVPAGSRPAAAVRPRSVRVAARCRCAALSRP